ILIEEQVAPRRHGEAETGAPGSIEPGGFGLDPVQVLADPAATEREENGSGRVQHAAHTAQEELTALAAVARNALLRDEADSGQQRPLQTRDEPRVDPFVRVLSRETRPVAHADRKIGAAEAPVLAGGR